MDEQARKRGVGSGGSGAAVVVLMTLLIVLPAIYVLSIGPIARLHEAGWIGKSSEQFLEVVYSPLAWTANNVPVVGPAIFNYIQWWVPTPPVAQPPPPSAKLAAPAPAPASGT